MFLRFDSIQKKITAVLLICGILAAVIFYFYSSTSFINQALKDARESAKNILDRSVQMFMVSTIKYHEGYINAKTEEEKKLVTDDWNRTIFAVDEAVIHDHGKGKTRVRLIGDEGVFNFKPLGGNNTVIEIPFERDSGRAIMNGETYVEKIEDDFLRVSVPLPSDAHPGCAECHGVSVDDHIVLGALNAYVPLTASYQAARSKALHYFLIMVVILTIVISITYWFLTKNVVAPIRKITGVIQSISQGDLTANIDHQHNDEIGLLSKYITKMTSHLRSVIRNIQESADQVAASSEELSGSSQNLASGASEQAANLEETSASINQLTSSIKENATNANETNSITIKAASEAEDGGAAVQETVGAMKKIAEQISIIDDIADQTNLLALNAAIEAARAGEMGKGFAVVAVEVRKLAERSQEAAKEISSVAQNSVVQAEKAGALITNVVPAIQDASHRVNAINQSCEEQSNGADQIKQAIMQLDEITQQNSAASEESASASEQLSAQAQQLKNIVSCFNIDTGNTSSNINKSMNIPGARPKTQSHKIYNAQPGSSTASLPAPSRLTNKPEDHDPDEFREF